MTTPTDVNPDADRMLRFEVEIVWAVPLESLPRYVRQSLFTCQTRRRRGPIKYADFKVVGWANLHPNAPGHGGYFCRRMFWLKKYDPYGGLVDGYGIPTEGVDPLTVAVGRMGTVTPRSMGNAAAAEARWNAGTATASDRGYRAFMDPQKAWFQ